MVEDNTPDAGDPAETFNTRFTRLKDESGLSFEALSDAIYRATDMRISAAGLHKYTKDGNIDEPQLEALCVYFGKSPAWFRYGIEPTPKFRFVVLGEAVDQLPDAPKQMVLQLLKYELADNPARIVSEPGVSVSYADFIDRVIKDMEAKRKGEKNHPTKDDAEEES